MILTKQEALKAVKDFYGEDGKFLRSIGVEVSESLQCMEHMKALELKRQAKRYWKELKKKAPERYEYLKNVFGMEGVV